MKSTEHMAKFNTKSISNRGTFWASGKPETGIRKPESGKGTGLGTGTGTGTGSGTGIGTVMERGTYIKTGYRKNSWERCLENDKVVINAGFPTVNCRK